MARRVWISSSSSLSAARAEGQRDHGRRGHASEAKVGMRAARELAGQRASGPAGQRARGGMGGAVADRGP